MLPNDPSSGTIGFISVDPKETATTTADSYLYNSSRSTTDSKHGCAFGGELA